MNQDTFQNPILPGFYPDPSICAANGKYYIVTSSFYYFPGLPVFESEDLVHWRQIGHAINRPDQLDYCDCDNSEGLWAATIRYHDGRFYIVNTLDVNAVKQVVLAPKAYEDPNYTIIPWVVAACDTFTEKAQKMAEEEGVRLFGGSEFASSLLDVGFRDLLF